MAKATLYTVRNVQGQLMGKYFAKSAQAAINRFWDEQNTYSSTFKSHGIKQCVLTAKIEVQS